MTNTVKYFGELRYDNAVPVLIRLLQDKNERLSGLAAKALVKVRNKAAVPNLCRYLERLVQSPGTRPDSDEVRLIILFISQDRNAAFGDTLKKILKKNMYQKECVSSLLSISDITSLPLLLGNFQYVSTNDREKLRVLSGKKGSTRYLISELKKSDAGAREFCLAVLNAQNLGKTNKLLAARAYQEVLTNDSSPEVRSLATEGLGTFGSRNSIPILVSCFEKDASDQVRLSCASALLELGYDPENRFLGFIQEVSLRTNIPLLSRKAGSILKERSLKKNTHRNYR